MSIWASVRRFGSAISYRKTVTIVVPRGSVTAVLFARKAGTSALLHKHECIASTPCVEGHRLQLQLRALWAGQKRSWLSAS